MIVEAAAVAVALALGVIALLGSGRATLARVIVLVLAILTVGAALIARDMVGSSRSWLETRMAPMTPVEQSSDGYVSSDSCQACHPAQYATWHRSYHRTMTQLVSPERVIGDFSNQVLQAGNRRFSPTRRGDNFWFDSWDSETGSATEHASTPVVMSTGSHHMQFYWAPTGSGRELELFPFAYLKEGQQWVPRKSVFLKPHSNDWSLEQGRWNQVCVTCHTTHPQPRTKDGYLGTPDTRTSEFGISCEACHGPAEQHVAAHRTDPLGRYQLHLTEAPDPTIVNPNRLSAARVSEVCGQCHGIWRPRWSDEFTRSEFSTHGFRYRPGDVLGESRYIARVGDPEAEQMVEDSGDEAFWESLFWSDGMVRVSGREYNGLIESPCFTHGDESNGILTCLSCHAMHQSEADKRPLSSWADDQLKPLMRGNDACTQCHTAFQSRAAVMAHTHHGSESSGSNCYNCHMPHTTYGLLKAIRSHQVDSPSVEASLATGRPNACNQCHLDQTLAWTSDHLEQWYGIPAAHLDFYEREVAASVLWLLRGDAGQRALMAWSMGWDAARQVSGDDWMAPYLGQLLDDPYDAVRFIAARSLRQLPGFESFSYDFVGSTDQRRQAALDATEIWNDQTDRSSAGRAVLIEHDGRLNRRRFESLLRLRNDRPVGLRE